MASARLELVNFKVGNDYNDIECRLEQPPLAEDRSRLAKIKSEYILA